jgi:hypothetical protein
VDPAGISAGRQNPSKFRAGPLVTVAVAVAALSALVIAPAPSYDPWAWLLWGREIAHGTLSTAEGPAFKPLTVAATTLLAPLGDAAPVAWVIVARTGAVLAVVLAFRVGRDLGGTVVGVVAAVGVALCGDLIGYSAAGAEPGWTIALALAGVEAWRGRRPRVALACAVGCALLRVEAWPFVLAFGIVLWRQRPQDRALLVACAVAVPALWFVPEWLGSGDPLRSGARARVPNPGQPATEAVPALAALREAAALPLWPLWIGAVLAPRAARPLLAAGLAWIALVAVMAQAGFSGEPRYSLPGAALLAIAGAAGLVAAARAGAARLAPSPVPSRPAPARAAAPAPSPRLARLAPAALAAIALAVAALPKLADLPDLRADQAYQRELAADLKRVIVASGGRDALLACGRPYTGDLRGPLTAYHLDVEKRRVQFDPRPPGAVFRSRIAADAPVEPPVGPEFTERAHAGKWTVATAC